MTMALDFRWVLGKVTLDNSQLRHPHRARPLVACWKVAKGLPHDNRSRHRLGFRRDDMKQSCWGNLFAECASELLIANVIKAFRG